MVLPLQLLLLLAALVHAEFLRSNAGIAADHIHPRSEVAGRLARHSRLETQASASGAPSALQTAPNLPVESVATARSGNGVAYANEARAAVVGLRQTRDTQGPMGMSGEPVLPTACPAGMPANDPFWAQESTGYLLDSHRDVAQCHPVPCPRNPTHGQRLATLRSLANATDVLMRTHSIDYTITSGTLLGAERCADIVPWDGDVDVQIRDSDRAKLDALVDPANHTDKRRSLDFIGFPTFVLLGMLSPANCFPWRIVDTATGYYSDIFAPVLANGVYTRPIHPGKIACDPTWLYAHTQGAPKACPWRTCDSTPADALWPSRRCRFADFYVNCPADNAASLKTMYSGNVDKPNVPTRNEP